jgi:hypothetical protein
MLRCHTEAVKTAPYKNQTSLHSIVVGHCTDITVTLLEYVLNTQGWVPVSQLKKQTLALPGSVIPPEHLTIWNHVLAAQTAAFHSATKGALTRAPDEIARSYLEIMGYGKYFTHRLGHGASRI